MDFEPLQRSDVGPPAYRQIAGQIRRAVDGGALGPGARLPAIRDLARRLGVNRDTVASAYELLASEGVVEAGVGRGTFVRADPVLDAASGPLALNASPPLAASVERLLDFDRARSRYQDGEGGAIALHSLLPDPSLYPLDEFRRALDRVLDEDGEELLGYGARQGDLDLREVIAAHLGTHELATVPEEVVLCQGASQGISLALRLHAEPGDTVAVEEPTYHNVLGAMVGLGLRPAPVPMTREGPDLDALARVMARPEVKLFYTMPSFHNPLGTTSSLEHRRRLLQIARRAGKPLIEDAFEMDLRYAGEPVPPLASLDTQGHVVHLFSLSKSLFPGVRTGAIVARGRAVDGLAALKQATDLSSAPLLQAAVAAFARDGGYERHLAGLRGRLRERRDALLDALERYLPEGTRWTRPEGGYQVWVELPAEIDTRALLPEAERAGVSFAPGYQFNHDGRPSSALRLTTALVGVEQIEDGVRALGGAVRRHLARGATAYREAGVNV